MPQTRSYKAQKVIEGMRQKVNRQMMLSLSACVHCGMCTDQCHYVLTNPGDLTYAPAYKADRIRKLFKAHVDWTGRVFPWWVGARSLYTDQELEELKDMVFGKCTNCRRCSFNCPMGVDMATFNRMARGLLVSRRRHARGRRRGRQGPVGDRQPDGRPQGGLPGDAGSGWRRSCKANTTIPASRSPSTRWTARSFTPSTPARLSTIRAPSPKPPPSSTSPARTGPCPARAGT